MTRAVPRGRSRMLKSRQFGHARALRGGLGALTAAALLWGCREPRSASGDAPPPVAESQKAGSVAASQPAQPTVAVRRETLRRCAPAVGSFRARQSTKLGPQVSGRVQDVLVDVGDVVREGQVLVQIDPTFFEIDVEQNRASVEAAQGALESKDADVVSAERELKRQRELFQNGAGSAKEHDDALTAYDRAVGDRAEQAGKLGEAQKKLEWAQQQLRETQIRAPYDGAITARMVDPGESSMSMLPTPLVEIQEVGVLYLEFALPQELLDSVAAGTQVEFEVEGIRNGTGSAKVAVVFPAIDEASRSFRCRAVVENAARQYQPGLLARVNVVLQEVQDALVVPRTALSQTAAGWQALVAAEGQPVVRPVTVGLVTDDLAQVLGGLTEGEQVIAGVAGRS